MPQALLVNYLCNLKRLVLVLLLFVLALAGISYCYYTSWRSDVQTAAPPPYIPQSAALVYEVEAVGKQWAAFQQTAIAQDLRCFPLIGAMQEGLHWLESLGADQKAIAELPLATAIHGLSEDEVGYTCYFDTREKNTQALLLQLRNKAEQGNTYRIEERKYAGYTITALSSDAATWQLHFIKQGPYLIASFSSLLIEDIVRGLIQKDATAFLPVNKSLNKQGSVYVNFNKLPQLLRVFFKNEYAHAIGPALSTLAQAGQLELKFTNHHLLLNGFTTSADTAQQHLVQTLAGQGAGSVTLAPYIPQSTALLQHVSFSDVGQLATGFQQYRQGYQPANAVAKTAAAIAPDALGTVLDPLLKGEIGLCTMGTAQKEQLLFMRVHHSEALMAALEELKLLTRPLTRQPHQLATIYQVTPDWFCNWLPSKLFPAFQPYCLTVLDDYLILANSRTALETLGKQCTKGKTWANIAHQRAFLSSTLGQAHFSLFVNTQQAWPLLVNALKPTWATLFETHAASLQRFEQASMQLVHEKQNTSTCYLSLLLQHSEAVQPEPGPQEASMATLQHFQAGAPIITKPLVVKTHKSEVPHTLLQDALYQVYFLDGTGKLVWKKALASPIVTDVLAIDFYGNNRLQYLFATQDALHLIDYHGNQVARYPQKLPSQGELAGLSVVDYAQDKNYRWLVTDTRGNIYLRDSHGRPLPGWNPKALYTPFAATPFHVRVNRDYFLVLQEDGRLHALNRKGQAYPGFPLDLEETTHNPLVVKKGRTAANTTLIMLSDEGKLSLWSLAGTLQHSIQLDKPEPTTRFALCPNGAAAPTYAIMRQDLDKFACLDEAGNLCFEKDHEAAQALLCQYYDFGEYQFYAITDHAQHLTHIYDRAGKAMHPTPLNNSHEIWLALSKDQRQLVVYSNYQDQCCQYILPID